MKTWAEHAIVVEAIQKTIDQNLLRTLKQKCGKAPARLFDAMRYSLLAPGKRLRPLLVMLACQLDMDDVSSCMPAAMAVEMVHTYSLIHDDLPAMDDDDLRRGQPTCHKKFDEATAILAGDGLLTLAFEVLADLPGKNNLAGQCVAELSRSIGALGMVGGQMEDIAWEKRSDGTLQILEAIHRRKTGALIACSLRMGLMIGQEMAKVSAAKREKQRQAMEKYADALGMVFQITDDLLDVTSNGESMGKGTQKDANRGKLTYPGLLGVEKAEAVKSKYVKKGLEAAKELGETLTLLLQKVADRQK